MTAPSKRVTISFTVPSALHLVIGLLLAAGTVIAWGTHFTLPPYDTYRATAANIGNLAGFVTVGYCIWCTTRRGRSDTADLTDVTESAFKALAERQEGLRSTQEELRSTIEAATTAILLALREIAEHLTENGGAMKRLDDAITGATGAVEALQDCYLAEGQALVLPAPEEVPRDRALNA